MAPWVGRLDHGRLPWRGRVHQLPADFQTHAIHGTVKDRAWEVEQADGSSVTLSCPLDDPWPFGGRVRQVVTLVPGRLELVAEVIADQQAMPASVGWHPWFARPDDADVRVRLAATGTLELRDDLVPTGQVDALDSLTDLRDGPALGDRYLDHVYTGVGVPAVIDWPDLVMTIGYEPPVNSVVVHTPPRGFAVEPQTAWPDAPALATRGVQQTGMVVVEPGLPLRARTTWSWTP
jgi:galactose mutarotase-like enzyme